MMLKQLQSEIFGLDVCMQVCDCAAVTDSRQGNRPVSPVLVIVEWLHVNILFYYSTMISSHEN